MPGKMNSTSGKISFTAVFAAFSSANCRRPGTHRVALYSQGLSHTRAEFIGLNQNGCQAAHVVHAGPLSEILQHFMRALPICKWKLHKLNSSAMIRAVRFISSATFRIA